MEIISKKRLLPDFRVILLTILMLHIQLFPHQQQAVAFVLPSITTTTKRQFTSPGPSSRLNERDNAFLPSRKKILKKKSSFSTQLSYQSSGENNIIGEKRSVGSEKSVPRIADIISFPLEQQPIQELPMSSSTDDNLLGIETITTTSTPIVLPASSSIDNIQQSTTVEKQIILPSSTIDTIKTTTMKTETPVVEVTNNAQQSQLIMPSTTTTTTTSASSSIRKKEITETSIVGPVLKKQLNVIQKWCRSWIHKAVHWRPAMKFRIRLVTATFSAFILMSWFVPRLTGGVQFVETVQTWLSSRGFQGIAAFGRSIAYGWAVFVGYPRLLDRRSKEQKRRSEEQALQRRQNT